MQRPQSSEHVQTLVSPAETALANIERTASHFRREIHLMLRAYGLTWTQYNVLRVLRDDRARGLTCSQLGSRLAAADPDVTRLLDRLAKQRLLRRRRDIRDRRSVVTEITPEGRQLLESIGLSLDARIRRLFDHIAPTRLQLLVELLEEARNSQKPNERATQPLAQTRTG